MRGGFCLGSLESEDGGVMRVGFVGASGFVGRRVAKTVEAHGCKLVSIEMPG